MKSVLSLLALFLSFAHTVHADDDPVISRYYGPSFDKLKYSLCNDTLADITATMKSVGHSILGSACELNSMGNYSVVVDYAHTWGKGVDQKTIAYSTMADCEANRIALTKAFARAELVPVYASCRKDYERGEAHVDYVRVGKQILSDMRSKPIFETKSQCEDLRKDIEAAFMKNKIEPIHSECVDVLSGQKTMKSMLELEFAIELGKGVHVLRGQQVDSAKCGSDLASVSELLEANDMPMLALYCEASGMHTYQNIVYISGIYTKLQDYAGTVSVDLVTCLKNLEQAKEALTKAKRTVIYSYCNAKEKNWMDPTVGYRPFVHYLNPPIVIDPTPVPNPTP